MPGLPMWAITITVTAVVITILFIGGSVYHAIRGTFSQSLINTAN